MSRFNHALCIYPDSVKERTKFFPPTGLEYVASALATRAPRVTIADLRHDPAFRPERRLHEFIRREGVDLLGVTVNWHFGFNEAVDFIGRLPRDIFTIVGGHEATLRAEEMMERCPNVEALARGEGEEIAMELASGKPLSGIAGLTWRRNGSVVHNEARIVGPIQRLPERDRSRRRVHYEVRFHGVRVLGDGFDTVLTSRGCPFNCKFCPENRNPLGKKRDYDERSAESVFEEVQSLEADVIAFPDDNFFVNRKRVERLCDMLIEAGIRKRYIAQARVELARSPHLLEKLVRAGFKMLLMGIESANDRSLEIFNKGFTVSQLREYFKVFRRFPIYYLGYFILGNIGETEKEMLAIPAFARELGLDVIAYNHLNALRFTPMRDLVQATPGYHIAPDDFVYSDRYSRKDLRRIRRRIRREFYTPIQLARAVRKLIRTGIFSPMELAALPFRLPILFYGHWSRKRKSSKSGKALQ